VPPERCAVVEDAAPGIAAAEAAGMTSIGLTSTGRTAESLAAAELVVGSLDELSVDVVRRLIEVNIEYRTRNIEVGRKSME